MEQFFTPADVFKMNGNQVPGLTILSHTEVVAQVPAGRVPETTGLGLGLGSFACFCHGGMLSKIVWITGDMPLMIGGVHQFSLTTTLRTIGH
jgi:hypothetical protein